MKLEIGRIQVVFRVKSALIQSPIYMQKIHCNVSSFDK